jgi:hypothetical protein
MFSVSSFANDTENKTEPTKPQSTEKSASEAKEELCRVSCSVSWSGPDGETVTVSASAGSIFTSCETAINNCFGKLENAMIDME